MNQKTRILIEETEEDGINLSIQGNPLNLAIVLSSAMNASPEFFGMVKAAILLRRFSVDEEE